MLYSVGVEAPGLLVPAGVVEHPSDQIFLSGFAFSVAEVASLTKEMDEFELKKTEARAVTGVLASHPNSTDVHISSLSLTFHGQELLSDTSLELNSGRRYGLIGLNGTGKAPRMPTPFTMAGA